MLPKCRAMKTQATRVIGFQAASTDDRPEMDYGWSANCIVFCIQYRITHPDRRWSANSQTFGRSSGLVQIGDRRSSGSLPAFEPHGFVPLSAPISPLIGCTVYTVGGGNGSQSRSQSRSQNRSRRPPIGVRIN